MPRGRPNTVDPDALAREAMALFRRFGFENVSMDQIALRAEVSRSTLFRYFPSKYSLVWSGLEETIARVDAALHEVPPTFDPVGALIEVYRRTFDLPPEVQNTMRMRLQLIEEQPALLAYGAPRLGPTRDTVAQYLEHQSWSDGFRVQVVAAAIAASAFAALTWWASTESPSQPGETVARALLWLQDPAAGAAATPPPHSTASGD